MSSNAKKQEARRTGVRGESYAYWYLRKKGYIDVMAIDNCPGQPPVVRLHKDAFSPQI